MITQGSFLLHITVFWSLPMLKRIIYIDCRATIKTRMQQLIINKDNGDVNSIPIEDVSIVIIDNPQITITNACLSILNEANVGIICCNNKRLPVGLMLPIVGSWIQTKRISAQVKSTEPLNKSIWKDIIKSKISNQYNLLLSQEKATKQFDMFIKNVKSGDTSNEEGKAARVYWKQLFGSQFKRERYGQPPNNLLNYGYAIIRAITARAIVSSGLHPSIGVHHKNQYDAYCLADDLMEPYRPYVDKVVNLIFSGNDVHELNKDNKVELIKIAYLDVFIDNVKHPLMLAIQKTADSLVKRYLKETDKLFLPCLKRA